MSTPNGRSAFTLVELLVVIGIIALLISILLPSLNRARWTAASTANLSNLRQLAIGLEMYRNDAKGKFPAHSSLKSETVNATPPSPRTRWSDALYPYLESTDVFISPLLNDIAREKEQKPFAHTVNADGTTNSNTIYWGGYGYNYQYLGNSRIKPGNRGRFLASTSLIRAASETIAFADTKGSRDGDEFFDYDEGTYVIDPPLQSFELGSGGSRQASADPADAGNYGYTGGDGSSPILVPDHRSTPDARNAVDRVAVVFVDGHGIFIRLDKLDDYDNDGEPDNGYWNGYADPTIR